jgi:hypothetical protein
MKTRYDTYYRAIPSLGRGDATRAGEAAPVRTIRSALHPVMRQPSVLEARHPEIIQAITLLWGYPEMNTYFEKLWLDDGSGSPIAPEAMSELMLLAGVHRWLTPQRPARNMASIYDAPTAAAAQRPKDLWDDVPKRR